MEQKYPDFVEQGTVEDLSRGQASLRALHASYFHAAFQKVDLFSYKGNYFYKAVNFKSKFFTEVDGIVKWISSSAVNDLDILFVKSMMFIELVKVYEFYKMYFRVKEFIRGEVCSTFRNFLFELNLGKRMLAETKVPFRIDNGNFILVDPLLELIDFYKSNKDRFNTLKAELSWAKLNKTFRLHKEILDVDSVCFHKLLLRDSEAKVIKIIETEFGKLATTDEKYFIGNSKGFSRTVSRLTRYKVTEEIFISEKINKFYGYLEQLRKNTLYLFREENKDIKKLLKNKDVKSFESLMDNIAL